MTNVIADTRRETNQLRFALRALSHRNYRLYFGGQGVSLCGTWMTRVATAWLVYRISPPAQAPFLLGLVSFCGQIPSFFLAPLAGVMVDRWNRRNLVIWTQVISMLQSFALAAAAYFPQSPKAVVAEMIWLNVLQGVVNAFDIPARQSFVVEMVTDRADLSNAIALNSSLVNGARLIGPSIAGILIALVGEFWCFLIDGVSYLAVLASLLVMKVPRPAAVDSRGKVWHGLIEGLQYSWRHAVIRALLIQIAVTSFLGMSYTVLMPLFAHSIGHGGADVMGFLMGASGVGALCGALYLAGRRDTQGIGRLIAVSNLVMGLGLMGFAYSRDLALSMALMLFCGGGMMVATAGANTLLQTIVEENKRGRVMALYTMAFVGMAPFGSLFSGTLAHRIGAPATLFVEGVLAIFAALRFSRVVRALAGVKRGSPV